MPADQGLTDSVANANIKNIAEAPAAAQAALFTRIANVHAIGAENAITQQQQFNTISNAVSGKLSEMLITTDPAEALGLKHTLTSDVTAERGMAQGFATAALQVLAKMAQTTPPNTSG